jgi:hypothetical protein
MKRLADFLPAGNLPYRGRDADLSAECDVCGTDQFITEARRRNPDNDHVFYDCLNGCKVLVQVVPTAEAPVQEPSLEHPNVFISGELALVIFVPLLLRISGTDKTMLFLPDRPPGP